MVEYPPHEGPAGTTLTGVISVFSKTFSGKSLAPDLYTKMQLCPKYKDINDRQSARWSLLRKI